MYLLGFIDTHYQIADSKKINLISGSGTHITIGLDILQCPIYTKFLRCQNKR